MDLMLSQLESLIHYFSVHLMTIQEQSSQPHLTPLDITPEPHASFWLKELRVARRVVTLMAVRGLPHRLPGPLRALGRQLIASEIDGQKAKMAIMTGMTSDDCMDLAADKRAGIPWQDAWWHSGAPALASDYGSRVAVISCAPTYKPPNLPWISCFPQLESLIHYFSVHLMTIQEQSSQPHLTPLDITPEPHASFWLKELRVARRVVTLMAVRGLPHRLPGPLRALGRQLIASEIDGQKAKMAIMTGMTSDDCMDLAADKRAGIPWQDAWWHSGAPALASDYGSRSMEDFAHIAVLRCGLNFRSSFRLGQVPVLRLRLMRREVADAYEANRHALHDMERHIGHKFTRLTQLADAFGFEELMLASMDGRFLGEEHSEQ
ncbi:hypothetical protein PAXINDRAFT_8453 [Paxillus involutus ATCC 200175]|nr:hypothetical protein PAXINDRAFT_8453 [Paxillus involutus ATCC 200175]